jgi:hypothetical protein
MHLRGFLKSTGGRLGVGGLALGLAASAIAIAGASCSQTQQNVPVRSLQESQNVDVACLEIYDSNGNSQLPVPQPQAKCTNLPAGVAAQYLQDHLFATVTQTTRGELAVVDLTSGTVVDEDKSTPGINFIPVGTAPTDVAVTHDGCMTFVTSAAETKPAIYGIPNAHLLGDYANVPTKSQPLRITDLQACLLPQEPQSLAIAPRPGGGNVLVVTLRGNDVAGTPARVVAVDPAPISTPAGVCPAGPTVVPEGGVGDAGVTPFPPGALEPCVILGATTLSSALPTSFSPGPHWATGVPYADVSAAVDPSPSVVCSGAGFPDAGGQDAGGAGNDAGASYPVAFSQLSPPHPTATVLRDDVPLLYVADAAIPVIHVIDVSNPTSPQEMEPLLATSLLDPKRRVVVGPIALSPPTHDFKRFLYAVDARHDAVMVFDVSDPVGSPHVPMQRPNPELNPFAEPDRITFSAPIAALAFVEHDWPLPSQMATNPPGTPPINQYTGVLCNPNPNAHPDADAGAFLDLGAYYRVDQAGLIQPSGALESFPNRLRGVFAFVTLSNGTVGVIDVDDWDAPCRRPDPMSAGPVMDLAGVLYGGDAGIIGQTGLLAVPQEPAGATADAGKFDPYRTPLAYNSNISESAAVTLEPFFPVSAPHRPRWGSLLLADPTSGNHTPYLTALPALYDVNGAPLAAGSTSTPHSQILPTLLPPNWIDYSSLYLQTPVEPNPKARTFVATDIAAGSCSYTTSILPAAGYTPSGGTGSSANVRLSYDDPAAHQDQDWAVTYEGALATVNGVVANLVLDDGDQTMTMYASGAQLCLDGIEDVNLAKARVTQLEQELANVGLPPGPPNRAQWTGDYVELVDDLLPATDGYWATTAASGNDCWGDLDGDTPSQKFQACLGTFGGTNGDGGTLNPDLYLARDFPIVQANSDWLQVARFGWDPSVTEQSTNRVIVPASSSNKPFLNFARCCFHHQAQFKVRAGGEWVTTGSVSGFLNHVIPDPATGNCKQNPDPRLSLLNARSFDIPWSTWSLGPPPADWSMNCSNTPGATPDGGMMSSAPGVCCPSSKNPATVPRPFFRDSPLAMRNPMFSFVMWSGCGNFAGPTLLDGSSSDHTLSQRDQIWRFSLLGSAAPITVSIAQGGTTAVSPQSMRFIPPIQQLAVVDGEAQGLVLIDLNLVAFSRAFY